VIGARCLATDRGVGPQYEHSLHSTLIAMRLAERLAVDSATASQTYCACMLFYVGCIVDAEIAAEIFDETALITHFTPVMFVSHSEITLGIVRALAAWGGALPLRAARVALAFPRAVNRQVRHVVAVGTRRSTASRTPG
jgi:hypothetical protein